METYLKHNNNGTISLIIQCPRCGQPGSLWKCSARYLVVVHKENGLRRRCYIGKNHPKFEYYERLARQKPYRRSNKSYCYYFTWKELTEIRTVLAKIALMLGLKIDLRELFHGKYTRKSVKDLCLKILERFNVNVKEALNEAQMEGA